MSGGKQPWWPGNAQRERWAFHARVEPFCLGFQDVLGGLAEDGNRKSESRTGHAFKLRQEGPAYQEQRPGLWQNSRGAAEGYRAHSLSPVP